MLIEKAAFRCFEGAQGVVFVKPLNGMQGSPPERRTPFFGASKRQRFLALKSQRHVDTPLQLPFYRLQLVKLLECKD